MNKGDRYIYYGEGASHTSEWIVEIVMVHEKQVAYSWVTKSSFCEELHATSNFIVDFLREFKLWQVHEENRYIKELDSDLTRCISLNNDLKKTIKQKDQHIRELEEGLKQIEKISAYKIVREFDLNTALSDIANISKISRQKLTQIKEGE